MTPHSPATSIPTDCRSPAASGPPAAQPARSRDFPPLTINSAHEYAITEILAERLPSRRLRTNPRVIKRKMSNWPVKRPEHRNPAKPTKRAEDAISILIA